MIEPLYSLNRVDITIDDWLIIDQVVTTEEIENLLPPITQQYNLYDDLEDLNII